MKINSIAGASGTLTLLSSSSIPSSRPAPRTANSKEGSVYALFIILFIYYYLWIPQIGSLIPNRGVSKKRVADTKYKKDEKRKKETNKIKKRGKN